jgi:hypothetical protein
MAKFTGVLAKPIKPLRLSMLDTEESWGREFLRIFTEKLEKLEVLQAYYRVPGKLGSTVTLLLLLTRLAEDTVPGFMEEGDSRLNRPGAPKKHDDHTLFLLLARVEALRMKGHDDKIACQKIATEDAPKLAEASNRTKREKRGKTLQNLLAKARAKPFGPALAALAQKRGKLTAQEYDALRFGIVDAKTFLAIEKIIAGVSESAPEI